MPEVRPGQLGWQRIAALATVYVIWGSTYLAIRFAVATLPPFLMAGVRFAVAGLLLYIWTRSRGTPRPTWGNVRSAIIVGLLLLVAGNGLVVWAETVVPSSLAALLISMTPIWMAVIMWVRPGGVRPSLPVAIGLGLGFVGVALLIGPGLLQGGGNLLGLIVLPLAALSWALGSVYSRDANMPASPLMGTALEMLAGGVALLIIGVVAGEPARVNLHAFSAQSVLALIYLIIFGSLIAFSAYVWLLKTTNLALVSTYAYVNPVVAVFLGWAFASEQLTPMTLIAAAVIVAAVVIITTFRTTPKPVAAPKGEATSLDLTAPGATAQG